MDKKRRRKLKPKHQAFIRRVKLRKGCQQCGYKRSPRALHFHHLDPTEKRHKGTKSMYAQWSMTKIKNEMRKCIILCANCHAEEHDNE